MKTKSFTFLLLLFFLLFCTSQGYGQKWWFHGITLSENLGCANTVHTKYRHLWLRGDSSYNRKYRELVEELRAAHGYDFLVRPMPVTYGKRFLIALVAKTRRCTGGKAKSPEVTSYGYYFGATKEAIQSQINSDLRIYTDLRSAEVKEFIPWEDEIAGLAPVKPSMESYETVDQGVKIMVKRIGRSPGKSRLLISFQNTNTKKAAVIGLKVNEKTAHEIKVLNSGGTMRTAVDNEEAFDYFIHLGDNRIEADGLLDKVKKRVREALLNGEEPPDVSSKKFSPACMCVRG